MEIYLYTLTEKELFVNTLKKFQFLLSMDKFRCVVMGIRDFSHSNVTMKQPHGLDYMKAFNSGDEFQIGQIHFYTQFYIDIIIHLHGEISTLRV